MVLALTGSLYVLSPETLLGGDLGVPTAERRPDQVSAVPTPTTAAVAPATTDTPTALHPGMQSALGRATEGARAEGVELPIASGYRSAEEQAVLLEEAIAKYGSQSEAQRWVFPPDRSMHVRGLAVDIAEGPSADWLKVHGHLYGLCQTLSWEWWHFEWRQTWEDSQSCPPAVDDPAFAPGP
jgi:LAS superfamily LD-carboxypeptidase LdcB